ncbi:MAG: phospho-N-acetylmuramoyl-pentapeptide-transferase [Planctomycetota bacterium]|nr:MAG: phospho-N-acetylmuramoyl-pentapeptide-transferase [Planctomycetota bacterium]
MLYLLFDWLLEGAPYAYKSPLFRATIAVLLAFAIVWALAPGVIRLLVRLKIGDRAEFHHEQVNRLTQGKKNTPTMGGALIVLAILVSGLLLADINNFYVRMGLFCVVWLTCLGGVDDYLKLTSDRAGRTRDGLRMWEKLVFQIALGALLAIFTLRAGESNWIPSLLDPQAPAGRNYNVLSVPFYKQGIVLATPVFVCIAVLVITFTSNAVNLTDGMDGLASGCMVLTSVAFMVLAVVVGTPELARRLLFFHIHGAAELAVLCGAVVGACLGFLWYNAYPAQVFMGDTGSLPLGGLIGYVAIVTRLELMLLIVGGVFVIEALSVLTQIVYFRSTGGKRFFRCAPLHHHFHLGGWTETQTVMRFWLLAALFATFALATIKLR